MIQIDIKKLPKIKQICDNWCVLACIENILKFYGEESYDQLDLYREFPLSLGHPYFQKICEKFGIIFTYFTCCRENLEKFEDYVHYLEEKIKENMPIIISTKSGTAAHALIPIETDNKIFKFFNPAKNESDYFRIPYNQIPNLLGNHRDILLIKRIK